jgi:hypothetical protein
VYFLRIACDFAERLVLKRRAPSYLFATKTLFIGFGGLADMSMVVK